MRTHKTDDWKEWDEPRTGRVSKPVGADGELSEAGWQSAILIAAKTVGWKGYHTHDSRRSAEGFPDLVLAKPGYPVIHTELKRWDGKLSVAQIAWLDLLSATPGSAVYMWRADKNAARPKVVWEELIDILRLGPGNIGRVETTLWVPGAGCLSETMMVSPSRARRSVAKGPAEVTVMLSSG